ncbi:Uncharacterised protein [Ectopseudomonas mendocina]|uniref:hypothetical protein n=1 Tax=Ectopseudomonas mendocina TaxID=300 RepID=UPI000E04BEEA|nr:hypothetical protein [Pseudomonas mendocina]SUD28209.1 Uncharacterised protein [Pseudomonas mendocina]
MQKTDTKQRKNANSPVSSAKKAFIAPKLEKLDTALTKSGAGTSTTSDFATYQS